MAENAVYLNKHPKTYNEVCHPCFGVLTGDACICDGYWSTVLNKRSRQLLS